MEYQHECAQCGRAFTASTSAAITCSTACRSKRWRGATAANAVKAAAELLHRQTAAVIAMTAPGASDADREHYRAELDRIAADAARILPAA
ncbi:hypothetical protein [Microbacterium aureliae]